MHQPKIALAQEFLNCLGGAEKVLISLANTYPEAPIYCLLSNQKFLEKYLPNSRVISSKLSNYPNFLTNRHQLFLNQFPVTVEQFDFSSYDIVLSSCNSFIKGIITKPSTIHVCYLHSPTRYFWDQTHEWINQKRLGLLRGIIEWRFNQIRRWDYLAADRVDVFVANSQHVARRIAKYYRRFSHVIYPPVETELITSQSKKQDYYLCFSRLAPFKKIDQAVRVFNELKLPLVVAGTGEELDYLKSIANSNIKFTGFVSDDEKIKLLQNAKALIFPGEEDFGIIPVEAMAAGTPVIGYGYGGLTESVIHEKTGLLYPMQTEKSLRRAINHFQDMKHIRSEDCRMQAEKFSTSNFIKQIKHLVDDVAKNPHSYLQKSLHEKK